MSPHEKAPFLEEKALITSSELTDQTPECIRTRIVRWRNWSSQQRAHNNAPSRPSWVLPSVVCGAILFGFFWGYTLTVVRFRDRIFLGINGHSQTPLGEDLNLASNFTCTPGQSCWPSSDKWNKFNQSIGGRLRITVPWAAPCYSGTSKEACLTLAKGYMNGVARSGQYGSMEFLDWEACGQSSCILNSFAPASPVSGECSLGRLSPYHVDARNAEDISKTLEFAQQHGIRVSIKNTGHDYFGRSTGANSLAIWTHNMKDTKYHRTFQSKGCKARYHHVGEIGAGIQAQEAWEFFEPLDMMVTVGAVNSVGIAGGFGQGGGHGPLGPSYGLMVDQAIEFDVVTAGGSMRTINECTDPDLFWAMRGGGGGTYAVLTSYRFQLHPAVPLNVYSFQAKFPLPKGELDITQSKVHRDVVRALAQYQTSFAQHGIAGYNFLLPTHMASIHVVPSADTAAFKKVTAQWHDFLTQYPNINITDNSYHTFEKFSAWHKFTETPSIARNGPVGVGLAESGRFLPKTLFSEPADIENVVDAVVAAMQFSCKNRAGGSAQLYATGPSNHPDNSKTGVNPAWRDAMWHVVMGGIWTSNTPIGVRKELQNTISKAIVPFKALTPGGGCYVNEGDWMEEEWQQTFFGSNYPDLEKVKRKWDPNGVFNCWKCVGWMGYDDPMYSCYAQSKSAPNPTVPLGPVD